MAKLRWKKNPRGTRVDLKRKPKESHPTNTVMPQLRIQALVEVSHWNFFHRIHHNNHCCLNPKPFSPTSSPKNPRTKPKQNPKQIAESILEICRRGGGEGEELASLPTAAIIFQVFSLAFLFFFFLLLIFPCSLFNLGKYLCVHLGIEGTRDPWRRG